MSFFRLKQNSLLDWLNDSKSYNQEALKELSLYVAALLIFIGLILILLQRRRSSILKTVRAPRTPLAELDTKPVTPTDQTVSRRVSFSKRTGVAEFITHEATTTWKNVYEEQHNFTVDSFANDSDGRPCPGPGRLFQGVFQDVEADLDAVDEPPVLSSRDTRRHQATGSINLSEHLVALETVCGQPNNPTAPVCHFEVSARTDNNLKPFDDNITEFIIGERSGVIEVDFSAIEPIREVCDKNDTLDLKSLDEAERNCANTNRSIKNPTSYPISESGEADMSLTDTVRPPCVDPPAVQRVSCIVGSKTSDWIADKENILLSSSPPQKINQSTVKTQEKVLVYDGKKLIYAGMDDDLDELENPLPKMNKAHANSNKLDKSMTMSKARRIQHQTNTFIFDKDGVGASVSISQCMPSKVKADHQEKKVQDDILESMNLTIGASRHTKNYGENVTVLDDNHDMTMTRCRTAVEQDYTESRNCGTTHAYTDSKYGRVCDGNIPMVQCLPSGLRSSVISSVISNKDSNRTSLNKDSGFDKDSQEIDMSVTQCADGRLVIGRKSENSSPCEIEGNCSENGQMILRGKDANLNMSLGKHTNMKIIEDENVRKKDQNAISNNKSRTLLFEEDCADADMSVTQCGNVKILEMTNVKNPNESISINNKRRTILFEQDCADADMSVTQCVNMKMIDDESDTNRNTDFSTTNKRRTILFEQDCADADMSVTQCANIKMFSNKTDINPVQDSFKNKRHTILFEQDCADADMSVTQCANIKMFSNKTAINPVQDISSNNKRHTILFEQACADADMSVTQCANIVEIITGKNTVDSEQDIGTDKNVHTIVFEQDNMYANMSVTRCANNLEIVGDNNISSPDKDIGASHKRHTITFEQYNMGADMSVTQCANGTQIIGSNHSPGYDQDIGTKIEGHTIMFEPDNMDVDMPRVQSANIQMFSDGNITNSHQNFGINNKRRTILFEKDDINANMSVTQCIDINVISAKDIVESKHETNNGKRHTISFENDVKNANMSKTHQADIHILGIKNIIKTGEVDGTNRGIILFEDDDIYTDIHTNNKKNITGTSVPKTDNAKQSTIMFAKNDELSMSQCSNVHRICDKDITYVTLNKTDHSFNSANSRRNTLCEKDDKTIRNVCTSYIPSEESMKDNHNDGWKFDVRREQQYPNELDITKNGSTGKGNAFKGEMLGKENVSNAFEDLNDAKMKKIDDLMNDSKHRDTVTSYTKRNDISLVFEKNANVSVPASQPERSKSFVEPITHDLNSPQGVEMRSTQEVDKISNSFNAFDINEPQALTVCAPVQVKYKSDRRSSGRSRTVQQKTTYDAELQTQNIENKHTSQDNISYSNVDAMNSSKKSVLNQLLDMSTDPIKPNDGQESLEVEEADMEEETSTQSSDDDKSSQTTSAIEEMSKRERWNLRCSKKRDAVDLNLVPSLDSDPITGTSDSSFTTSDEYADKFAAKLDPLDNSRSEGGATLNRRFESVISSVAEEPNDTAELLEALDHLTQADPKSVDKSRRSNTIDSGTTTEDVDLSRRSVAINVNDLEASRRPRTEDSAIGPDTPNEWSRRHTLRFQDEVDASPAERDRGRVTPLKKRLLETTQVRTVPRKGNVIPEYLKEMSEGVKELMSDLMKPMVDMLPHTSVCAAPVPDHETHGQQVDLAVSSQVSSMHEIESVYPAQDSPEIPPTSQTPPEPSTPPSHLRRDMAEFARRAVNRALHRHTSFDPVSVNVSPKSSRSDDEEEIPDPSSKSPPRVLTFDRDNPLNNVLLRPYVPSELPSASPSAHDYYCVNESNRGSSEDVGPTEIHYCPKHGVRSPRKPMDIGCVTVDYDMQNEAIGSKVSSPSSAPVRSSSPSIETRVGEVKDTEVNTLIAMKTNSQLLQADSELTVADAGDSPLKVTYHRRVSAVETSESELAVPAPRPLKRSHVTPALGTPSPRPPQKVHRRPTSPQILTAAIVNPDSRSRTPRTSTSPPSKRSSPKQSSQTDRVDKSSDKIGSFASSREHAPFYQPVYTAPVSPSGDLRAQIDALPFMGSRDCAWETAVTRAERGEAHKRGAWWWFRLLHSRLRLGVRIAHVAGASPDGDAVLAELVVTADLHGCRDPVVALCVRLAADAARALCADEHGAAAGRTPLLLQRLASLSRLAARWGRAVHDARLSLALAVEEHGAISFNVANVPLRCVWEVRMHAELSAGSGPARTAWPRAARLSARLASPGRAAALAPDELQTLVSEVPHNWGHVPTTIWRVFRYLKNKTHYEATLGA